MSRKKIEIEARPAGHLELAKLIFQAAEREDIPESITYLLVKAGDMILADWHRFHRPNMEKIMQIVLEEQE